MNIYRNSHLTAFVAILLICVTTTLSAQNFGYINSQAIISLMPEAKAVQKQLEDLGKTYEEEFSALAKELETKAQKYQSEAKSKSDAINTTRAKELQDMEKRLQEYRQTAAQEVQQKQSELLAPVLKKAQKAIEKVAKAKSLKYVFDSSKGLLLYADEADDILEDVKKELKIK